MSSKPKASHKGLCGDKNGVPDPATKNDFARSFKPYERSVMLRRCRARPPDALCLDKDERILRVPRGIEGIGNSNIWFPELTSLGKKFLKSASTLIQNGYNSSPKRKFRKTKIGGWQSDIANREKIERLAMNAVAKWYASQGYDVSSVANQNLGWDLEALLKSGSKKSILKIEVKGLSKNEICVELTPNALTMQLHSETFRLCVVTNPQELSKQKIHRFGFSIETGKWHDQTGTVLSVVTRIGAKCTV